MASFKNAEEVRAVLRKMHNIRKTREQFYAHIGHAVSSFSAIEHGLLTLFYICSDKLTENESIKLFGSIGYIKQRILLVDYAVSMKAQPNDIAEWKSIKSALSNNKEIRNFASHYHVELQFDGNSNPIGASLRRPLYAMSGRKEDELISEERLENTCRELDQLHARIEVLLESLATSLYRKDDKP